MKDGVFVIEINYSILQPDNFSSDREKTSLAEICSPFFPILCQKEQKRTAPNIIPLSHLLHSWGKRELKEEKKEGPSAKTFIRIRRFAKNSSFRASPICNLVLSDGGGGGKKTKLHRR